MNFHVTCGDVVVPNFMHSCMYQQAYSACKPLRSKCDGCSCLGDAMMHCSTSAQARLLSLNRLDSHKTTTAFLPLATCLLTACASVFPILKVAAGAGI